MPLINTAGPTVRVASHDPDTAVRDALASGGRSVPAVGSTGLPSLEPLVAVTADGRTGLFAKCTREDGQRVASLLDDGVEAAFEAAAAVAEHEPDTPRLPTADLGGLSVGDRSVLGPCGWLRPTDPDDYASAVGFALPDRDAIETAGASMLGRGWADWCRDTALLPTWETARESDGSAAVLVNAHGTPADALLLSSAPFAVLHGAMAAARAADADRVVVYCSAADERAIERAEAAAGRYPDPPAPVTVGTGPDVYRAAEPTMAIEAVEGNHRLEARLRPPGPDAVGIDGDPTVVHTPRTLAHLAAALTGERAPGTRIVTVAGDVAAEATVELPEMATLSDALDAVDLDDGCKAACVGGRFGGLTDSLSLSPDPESLTAAGLGTEGTVEVLGEDRCVVRFVGERAQFAADTNCGRCVPCREGTTQLADLLRDLYDGEYDRDGIEELLRVMESSSICAFGADAGRPTRTAMDAFESEFHAHADGRCPAGSCPQPLVTHS